MNIGAVTPTKVEIPTLRAVYSLEIVKVEKYKVIFRVGLREYIAEEGDTLDLVLSVS